MEKTFILIIDPDEASRHFLAQTIAKRDYVALQAASAKEGLKTIADVLPSVVVFDTKLTDYTIGEFMHRMKQEKRTSIIPVVAMSSNSDPDEMEKCLEAGCVEFYIKSGSSIMALINSIPDLIMKAKQANTQSKKNGLLCAFLSAKGGIGTSSLCANIGMNIAKNMIHSTISIADLVLPIGSIAQIVGYEGDFNVIRVSEMDSAAITPAYLKDNLISPASWFFHLLPGSPDPSAANQLKVDRITDIIKTMRATYDYVLVDLGRALSRISLPIIQEADIVVLVLSTDLSTASLTKKTLNYLIEQGIESKRIYPILNRAVGLEGLSKADAEKILGINIRLTVPYMMSNFTLANNQNIPVTTKFPTDTVSLTMKQAAVEISEMAIAAQAKK